MLNKWYPMIRDHVRTRHLDVPLDSPELTQATGDLVREWFSKPISDVPNDLPPQIHRRARAMLSAYHDRISAIRTALSEELPTDGSLEIVSMSRTKDSELDIVMRNVSSDTICITRIALRVLRDHAAIVSPMLQPSATYTLPLGNLMVGETTELDVSHIIGPHGADRIRIALDTTRRRVYIRVTFDYNKRYSVSENVWL